MTDKVFQVSELNEAARDLLEMGFSNIAVEGEISNLSRPVSGHLYFSLKDEQSSIACALFKGSRFGLRMNWAEIANGLQVRVQGRVSLYAPRGQYQLIAHQLEPAGLGELEREYQLRLQRLQAEGIFALENKRSIPKNAMRIGVITSATGAAIHDVLNTLKRRNPAAEVVIYPCLVQGKEAPAQIIAALNAANRRQECEVLLMVRGGGSLEDLWAFNDEALARAVAASAVPIVSGVGHEVDTTLVDFAADYRSPTPTAAAEMVSTLLANELAQFARQQTQLYQRLKRFVQHEQQMLLQKQARFIRQEPRRQIEYRQQRCDELQQRLQQALQAKLKQLHLQQAYYAKRLGFYHPKRLLEHQCLSLTQLQQRLTRYQLPKRLQEQKQRRWQLEQNLQLNFQRLLRQQQQHLHTQAQLLLPYHPKQRLLQAKAQIERLSTALTRQQDLLLHKKQQQFENQVQQLALLNPLAVLSRGYAVVENQQGEVVSSALALKIDEAIRVQLADGRVLCQVKSQALD